MESRTLIREAQNIATTAARLAELAAHPDEQVRRAVARHGSLDAPTLEKLLDDSSWEVRTVAAHHKNAPKEKALAIVLALAVAPEVERRRVAARSPLVPVETLIKLTEDADVETRSNAAKNVRTPPAAARAKLTDPEPAVVLGALAHPSISNDERRGFVSEDLLTRFFEAHADGDTLFEALCERYLWDVLERAFLDPERFDDVWQELVGKHFELVEIPSRGAMLAAVQRDHWKPVIQRLVEECRGKMRQPD
jgi:hypothetical protein